MYSTWKIALLSAWAGPSWISWPSRDRSASWASMIRILRSLLVAGPVRLADQGRVAALEEEPGPLERLPGQLELGQLGLVRARSTVQVVDVAAQRPPPRVVRTGLGGDRPPPSSSPSGAVRGRVSRGSRSGARGGRAAPATGPRASM